MNVIDSIMFTAGYVSFAIVLAYGINSFLKFVKETKEKKNE